MPQTARPGYSGLLSKWLPDPAPPVVLSQPNRPPPPTRWTDLRDKVRAVANYEPFRNAFMCNLAKNFWIGASQVSGTSLNTPTEKAMMGRYFGGGGGAYRLNPGELDAATRYYNMYDKNVLSGPAFPTANGGKKQNINFAKFGENQLDGLLGTATGYFDKDRNLTGLYDVFDFDDRPRGTGLGDGPLGRAGNFIAGKTVGQVQKDADTFCPRGANPVTITGGSRR